MERMTDHKISEDPSRGRLIEIAGTGPRSANCPICAAPSVARCWKLRRHDVLRVSFIRPAPEATQTGRFALRAPTLLVLLLLVFSGSAQSQSPSQNTASQNETARAEELIKLARAAIGGDKVLGGIDRKSTRLNSSHLGISYAVFCLKKKKKQTKHQST